MAIDYASLNAQNSSPSIDYASLNAQNSLAKLPPQRDDTSQTDQFSEPTAAGQPFSQYDLNQAKTNDLASLNKNAPAIANAAAMAFFPESIPLKILTMPAAGAAIQGGTQYALNKLEGNPDSTQNVGTEAEKGGIAGGLAYPMGFIGNKILGNLGNLTSPATDAESELASSLAARTKTPGFSLGPLKIGGNPIQKTVGPEMSDLISQALSKASTQTLPTMQNAVDAGVSLEDAPDAVNTALNRRQNTIDAISKLKGISPEGFMKSDLLPSQNFDISKDITQPLTDAQNNTNANILRQNNLSDLGKKVGRYNAPTMVDYMIKMLSDNPAIQDANSKIEKTYNQAKNAYNAY